MHKDREAWEVLSDIEKIAWLWNETNSYVENFLATLSSENYIQIRAEDMFSDPVVVTELFKFVGLDDIKSEKISKMQKRQVNQQRVWTIESYSEWDDVQKEELQRHAVLAKDHKYML